MPERWRMADLIVDAGLQKVVRGDTEVDLPRLSFSLLLELLRAAPRFVSNEELMQRVWVGLVVSPETVTQRVKLLRDALGDDPRDARYIQGLRGRGYRLIPAVEVIDGAPGGPVSPAPARRLRPLVAAATLLALLAAVAWLGGRMQRDSASIAADARSAAVMAFKAGSDVREDLASGFADSVAHQLSQVRGLTVIATHSTQGATGLAPREAGGRLGARYLVEGSLQLHAGRLRVTARMLDSSDGRQLWTRQYERDVDQVFALQDAVAGDVMRALEARIAGLDTTLPTLPRSAEFEAQLAYLRGRALLGRTTVAGSDAAAAEFERALGRDPQFVAALAGLYDARLQAASLRRTNLDAAREAHAGLLERARALDPSSGAIRLAEAMWSNAPAARRAEQFEQGLREDPSNARAMTAYSELLDDMGRGQEGARWLERALRVDPLWPRAHFRSAQRNFDGVGAAIERQNLRTLELDPMYYPALQRQAKYRWQMSGDVAEAISIIGRAIEADPENPWGLHTQIAFLLDAEEPDAAEALAARDAVAAASTAALRAQYRGDWRAAGEAALAAGSFVFGNAERWGVPAAIRDWGLRTGRLDEAIAVLAHRYALPPDKPWSLSPFNFREAQLVAHLLLRKGDRAQAMRRLDEVLNWIDANAFMGPVYNLRTRAQVLALKGERDAALDQLAESFRQLDYTLWWYTLHQDPTWEPLRGDRRFVAIATSVRAHIDAQKARLAALRIGAMP